MDNDTSRMSTPTVFCRSCGSPLVQALDWEQDDKSRWNVRLWCPDCAFEQAAVLNRSQLVYLTLAIEEGFVCMLDALAELRSIAHLPGQPDLVKRAKTDRIDSTGY